MATINGTPGDDILTGTQFRDSIFGFAGDDILNGNNGNDTLNGGGDNDTLNGGAGNDTLQGGEGNDTLNGGTGNDTYIINSAVDTITEAANAGIDTVQSSVTYTLGSNLENLTLTGTAAINGTGNSLDNTIIGNDGNNILTGGAGNDTLKAFISGGAYYSTTQEDILYGGDGDDRLEGDTFGTNRLHGGNGDDTLIGNGSNGRYDVTNRLYGGDGDDSLSSDGGVLYGGDGNDSLGFNGYSGGTLYGDNGNDTLRGSNYGDGTLNGGAGNDTYVIDSTGDTLIEAANGGIDTVQFFDEDTGSYTLGGTLENLTLGVGTNGTGNSLNNIIIGSYGSDILRGQAGNDTLRGQAGNDTLQGSSGLVGEIDILTGGAGRDTFVLGNVIQAFYDDGNSATSGKNDYALITDFNTSQDIIRFNGAKNTYVLAPSPSGLPAGTAVYRNKPGSEPNELIAVVQGSSSLSLDGDYFSFKASELDLADLNGSTGFKINGIDAGDSSGFSVSNAGDINGDGFDDLLIGTYGADDPNGQEEAGESYVVFGQADGFGASLNLSQLNGSNGFVIKGIDEYDYSGSSVSNAGDIDGDGLDDLLIGARGAGESYVVFGQAGFGASLNLSQLNGSNGFVIDGGGSSVSTAGDINGDGFDELLIGAPFATSNGQEEAGKSYVVFGRAEGFGANLNLSQLDGSNGFVIKGIDEYDSSGYSVSTAGDIDGDGFDDLIIGTRYAAPNGQYSVGESYVVFGQAGGFGANLNLSQLDGSNGFVINGVDEFDYSGRSVSTAGDVNGDGFDDLIIGASGAGPDDQYGYNNRAGESYVVFGQAEGFGASLNLSQLNGSNGFVINGIDEDDRSGRSVSTAGDVNGDGFDDLIIGAVGAGPDNKYGTGAGESYVVFGQAESFGANLNLSQLNGSNGFVINGVDAGDFLSGSVSNAGDVNGDGFDDLVIGASGAGQYNAGESYVVFGRDFTGQVNRPGTSGNDLLTGTTGNDILVGGLGNDQLFGGQGVDVLKGGSGNDLLSFGSVDRRTDGGSGNDTLSIEYSGANLDLTTISNNKIIEIEKIDITGTGNNRLKLNRLDLLDLSDTTNRLIVNGNTGDKVTSTGQGWLAGGTTTLEGILYDRYTAGQARLLVDTDITQMIS